MNRSWLGVLIGAALVLAVLGAWFFVDDPRLPDHRVDRESPTIDAATPARSQASGREDRPAGANETPAQRIGAVLVAAEDGPLTLGVIELWCDDGRFAERVWIDEDGSFTASACATTTCVRLRHPIYEQPIAWALAPGERRELEVSSAPRVHGVVVDPIGLAVPAASLVVRSDDGRRVGARTDAAGAFVAALPGLRPCDSCDRERGSPVCREHAPAREGHLHGRVLVSAPAFAPAEFDVDLEAAASTELVLAPPAAPITGVVRGTDHELFELRTKILATNVALADEQHHAQIEDGRFELRGLADARYRLRAVRDGRELAVLDNVAPGAEVELRADQPARGIALQLEILDASAQPVDGVRVDGGPFTAAMSDHAGRVAAFDVGYGSYTLRVRAGDCEVVRVVVDVTPRQADDVQQTLRLPSSCDPR
jgi:hypothetical protein